MSPAESEAQEIGGGGGHSQDRKTTL